MIDELSNLLNETAEAHLKAFAATASEDPDWHIRYASYFLDKMQQVLKAKFTKIEVRAAPSKCLIQSDSNTYIRI